ncbi:MAG: hypothetical protein ACTSR8_21775 [Promethearchaeota archaeon]
MEELKKLYKILQATENEQERLKLWEIIIALNKKLLNEKKAKLDKILNHRIEVLKKFSDKVKDRAEYS